MSKKAKEIEEGFAKMFNDNFLDKLYEKDSEFIYLNPNKIKTEKQIRSKIDTTSKKFLSLLNSIREHGILHPLIVRPIGPNQDEYVLVAGHQRLQAARILELPVVPVRIIKDIDENKIREIQFVENIQRDNIGSVDLILSVNDFYRLRFNVNLISDISVYIFNPEKLSPERKIFIDRIVNITRKSPRTLFNMLRILKLPDDLLEKVKDKKISLSAGYILANLYEKDIKVFDYIIEKTKRWRNITPKKLEELLSGLVDQEKINTTK